MFGDFAEAARSQLSATTGQLMSPAEAMRAAALVLESYQPLLTRVEELRAQLSGPRLDLIHSGKHADCLGAEFFDASK